MYNAGENDLQRYRMDFVLKEVKEVTEDKENLTVKFLLEPDPRRYEWKEIDGKKCLFDKLDNSMIPLEVLTKATRNMKGLPIYYQPSKISDAEAYVESRIVKIKDELKGTFPLPTFEDKSEEFLGSLKGDQLGFVILSLDIVGSTKLSTGLDPKKYKHLIEMVLYELSEIIPLFNGYVLKYTGDGIIAYFPEPSFVLKHDLAIDCALTFRRLVYNVLNTILKEESFPTIDIRIGLDSGNAYIATVGSHQAKQHKDIIGSIVNLAAKIQQNAKPSSINIGQTTYENLHTSWRLLCKQVPLPAGWEFKNSNGVLYRIYEFNLK